MGEDQGSILLKMDFFLLIHVAKKMLVNIIILILFTDNQNFLIMQIMQKQIFQMLDSNRGPF